MVGDVMAVPMLRPEPIRQIVMAMAVIRDQFGLHRDEVCLRRQVRPHRCQRPEQYQSAEQPQADLPAASRVEIDRSTA